MSRAAKLFPDMDEANGVKIEKELKSSGEAQAHWVARLKKGRKTEVREAGIHTSVKSYLNLQSLLMLLKHCSIKHGTEGYTTC